MYRRTADEIMEKDPELAIIPVGSIEQHGHHLPVMTDWAIASALGKTVAEKMDAFLLPALPVSTCREQMGKKGSVWMEPLTFYQMMTDMILSLRDQGFRRVGIIQCHGGIFIMTPLVRDLNARYNPDLQVAVFYSGMANGLLEERHIIQGKGEIHAGEKETSLMLAIAPETVHMDRAVDCLPTVPRSWLNYGSIYRASPHGVWGEPSLASREKGEKILETLTEACVEELSRAFAYMDKKEPFHYSNF